MDLLAHKFNLEKNIPFIGFSQFPNSNNKEIQNIGKKLLKNYLKIKLFLRLNLCIFRHKLYELEKVHGKEKDKRTLPLKKEGKLLPVKTFENVLKWLNADFL